MQMSQRTSPEQDRELGRRDFVFFLEGITNHLHVPYLLFFSLITIILEVSRIVLDYVIVVGKLQLSVADLVALWRSNWLVFLWPVCMLLMYFSMRYLRNYALHTVGQIRPRMKETPTRTLAMVFRGRIQHLIPLCFLVICVLYFVQMWIFNNSFTFYHAANTITNVSIQEIPLKFIHTAIWITYNWIIGGYFSWICISTIVVAHEVSKQVHRIDVFDHDRSGGLSIIGSYTMRTAMLYIFSVSFMFPGWIITVFSSMDLVSLVLQIGALSSLVGMELGIFLLPMTFFHWKMMEAKNEKLTKLEAYIAGFNDSLTNGRVSDRENRKLQNTIALRQIALSMTEYPFNLGMLAGVSFSAATPYIVAVIQLALEPALHHAT
jgi:hypothetical protein